MTLADAAAVLNRQACARHGCRCMESQRHRQGLTHCLAHDDENASMSVTTGDNGRLLLHCHAGCTSEQLMAEVKKLSDKASPALASPARPLPAVAKSTTRYEVKDAEGRLVGVHVRQDLQDGSKRLWWEPKGIRPGALLYGAERLRESSGHEVILVEGERAADSLLGRGYLAVGTVGGANRTPDREILQHVAAHEDVWLWPDRDDVGRSHMDNIAAVLRDLGCEPKLIEWAEAPPKGDAADWSGTKNDLAAMVRPYPQVLAPADPEPRGSLGIVSATAWAAGAGNEPPAIIDGILASRALAVMASEPKAGKTWLALSFLLAVANGVPFLGAYPVNVPGKALYIATEGGRAKAVARFSSLARGLGLDPRSALENIDISWRTGARLDDPDVLAELAEAAPRYRLIIGDVLADLFTGDENKASEMAAFCRGLKDIAADGPTILLLHHTAKMSEATSGRRAGQKMRGSSALHGAIDSGIYLARKGEDTQATVMLESRDDAAAAPFTFAWPADKVDGSQSVTLDHQRAEEGLTDLQHQQNQALAIIRAEPGISPNALRERLHGRTANRAAAIAGLLASGAVRERLGVTYVDTAGRERKRTGLVPADGSEPQQPRLVPVPNEREREGTGTANAAA